MKKLSDYRCVQNGQTIRLTSLDLRHLLSNSKSINYNHDKFIDASKYQGRSNLFYTITFHNSQQKKIKTVLCLLNNYKQVSEYEIIDRCYSKPNTFSVTKYTDSLIRIRIRPPFVYFGRCKNTDNFSYAMRQVADIKCIVCECENAKNIINLDTRYEALCYECYSKINKYFTPEELAIQILNLITERPRI